MRYRPSRSLALATLFSLTLLVSTVAYRIWIGDLLYVDRWQSLTREIDAGGDIQDEHIQSLMKQVGDARFLGDLGLCYVLRDSLWVNGRNVSQSGVLYTFDVMNDGQRPVRIEEVSTSCGCAKADLPTRLLSPGARVPLALSISHEKLSDGPHNYWVTLKTDGGASWRYGVKVDIVRAASWEQTDVYFGNVATSKNVREATAVLQLFQPTFLKELQFQGVRSNSDLVKADVLPTETTARTNGIVLHRVPVKLTLDPQSVVRDGQGSCDVTASYVVDGKPYEVSERVHWERVSAYMSVPARLVLRGSQESSEPIRVTVSHSNRIPFRIVSVQAPEFLSRLSASNDRSAVEHQLAFEVALEKLPARHDFGNVVVQTNITGDDTMTIPLVFLRVPN